MQAEAQQSPQAEGSEERAPEERIAELTKALVTLQAVQAHRPFSPLCSG